MESAQLPDEEKQVAAYRSVAEQAGGNLCVIRTLDIGGDKHCDCLSLEEEDNPFLGFRAIRICLQQKDMFKVQLRSILRAGLYGKLAIMIPMAVSYTHLIIENDEIKGAISTFEDVSRLVQISWEFEEVKELKERYLQILEEMCIRDRKRCYQKDHPYVVFVLSGFDAGRIILYFI